jgi:hypothetical protein
MLEPDQEVIGERRDDHVTMRVPAPPCPGPGVEDVVEVDVGEQRRDDTSDTMGNFEFEVALPYVRGEKLKQRSTTHSDANSSMHTS